MNGDLQGAPAARLGPRPAPSPPLEPTPAAAERRGGLTPLTLLLVLIVGYLLIQVQFVLVLVLLALVFATVIDGPVSALERRHIPRPLAILLVYAGLILAVTVLFLVVSPAIRDQATAFRTEAPRSLAELREAWLTSGNALLGGPGQLLLTRAIQFIENPSHGVSVPQGAAIGLLTGIGGGLFGFVTLLVVAFYYLMEKPLIRRLVLIDTPPETRIRVSRIWDEVERKVGDWLRGQLTLCLVIGLSATIGYAILGVSFWPLLGLWAGVMEIIPILGPWLGGIPAVIIALTQSWEKALLVIGFVVIMQLTENMILVPRVMKDAVGLSPLTVFVAILAGTEFAGIAGALLAIPIAAAVQVLFMHHTEARREAKLAGHSALPGWRWMRGSVAPPGFSPGVTAAAGEGAPAGQPEMRSTPTWTADVLSRAGGDVEARAEDR